MIYNTNTGILKGNKSHLKVTVKSKLMANNTHSNQPTPAYQCKRCGYASEYKHCLERHLHKKIPCLPLLSDAEGLLESQRSQFARSESKKTIPCQKCGKLFSHSCSMYRHKKYCNQTTDSEKDKTTQERLNRVEEQLQTVTNNPAHIHYQTTNQSNCNNNNNNTIQVVNVVHAFGNETIAHLNHGFLSQCIRRTNKGFIELLKKLHFDPNVPENDTVRIMNKKLPLAEIRDAKGEWAFARRDKVMSEMIDKGQGILQEHFDDYQEEIRIDTSETMWNYIVKWMEKMSDRDKTTIEDVLLDIYVLLLNNSRKESKQNSIAIPESPSSIANPLST